MLNFRSTGAVLGALAVGMAWSAGSAVAQTAQSFTATVEVRNSMAWTEVNPLDFGQVVVIDDGTNDPTVTLSPTGTFLNASAGTSGMVQLGTPSGGTYTIATGAATFSNITITFPGSATLSRAGAPPGNGTFTVDTFSVGSLVAGTYTGGTANATACNGAINAAGGDCEFLTSGSGEITVPLGATLAATSGDTYIEGIYSGSFELSAAFN